jgi:hypothetical protein
MLCVEYAATNFKEINVVSKRYTICFILFSINFKLAVFLAHGTRAFERNGCSDNRYPQYAPSNTKEGRRAVFTTHKVWKLERLHKILWWRHAL